MFKTKSVSQVRGLSNAAKVKGLEMICEMTYAYVRKALDQAQMSSELDGAVFDIAQLSNQYALNPNALRRALRFHTFYKTVQYNMVDYQLRQEDYFLEDSFGSFAGAMHYVTAPFWLKSWDNFYYCLETGRPAFNHLYHQTFFEFIMHTERESNPFYEQMKLRTSLVTEVVGDNFDFSQFDLVCDVGGGQGGLLRTILDKYPEISGILFDVDSALQHHLLHSYPNRVELLEGNFFEKVPNADCMILKTILHDWDDAQCIQILENCRKSLESNGSIILVAQLVEEPFSLMQLFYDLHMLVMYGGAERGINDFSMIAHQAGLNVERVIRTNSPLSIIELKSLNR